MQTTYWCTNDQLALVLCVNNMQLLQCDVHLQLECLLADSNMWCDCIMRSADWRKNYRSIFNFSQVRTFYWLHIVRLILMWYTSDTFSPFGFTHRPICASHPASSWSTKHKYGKLNFTHVLHGFINKSLILELSFTIEKSAWSSIVGSRTKNVWICSHLWL